MGPAGGAADHELLAIEQLADWLLDAIATEPPSQIRVRDLAP
jgi:hypothetical protein